MIKQQVKSNKDRFSKMLVKLLIMSMALVPVITVIPTIVSAAVPISLAQNVVFTDTDLDQGQIAGSMTWQAAADVTNITYYHVYYLNDSNVKVGNIVAEVAKTNALIVTIAANTLIPDGATKLGVFSKNNDGESTSAATVTITDVLAASTSPLASNITATNNYIGVNDSIVISGLLVSDIVNVYNAAVNGIKLGTATGQTTATISVSELGAYGGSIYVTVTSTGKSESARTAKSFAVAPKAYSISTPELTTVGGVSAKATISKINSYSNPVVVVFQLRKGTESFGTVAFERTITDAATLNARFNVTGSGYTVEVYVYNSFSTYNSSNIGTSLAVSKEISQ